MFRTVGDQVSLWEAVLPAELLKLPDELARVDALLDDPVFFAPFVPFFDRGSGVRRRRWRRYLRLMFLKFRYRLGYESLCREVSDSITWRRFCRIPLDGCGAASDDVDEADHPVRAAPRWTGSTRPCWRRRPRRRCCAPTGFAPTPRWCRRTCAIRRTPGLLAKAIRRIGTTGQRIHDAGGAVRTRLRDRSRAAGKRAHGIAAKLRSRANWVATRSRTACSGSPVSSPTWPRPPPGTRNGCWSTPTGAAPGTGQSGRAGRRPGARCGRGAPAWSAGPRRQRPVEPAGGDRADHRADPATDRRDHPGWSQSGGQSARP